MAENPAGSRGKGRKIGRNRDYCDIYKKANLQDKHRKRRMQTHLRNHPLDTKSAAEYERTYGKVGDLGLTGRGRKRKAWGEGATKRKSYRTRVRASRQ